MQSNFTRLSFILGCVLILSSCGASRSSAKLYDPNEVAQLSKKLGIKLSNTDKEDDANMPLYVEISRWLGTPYRYAGNTKRGVDCSGFTYNVYEKIFGKKLPRSASGLVNMKQRKVSKRNLRAGDLVYFATTKNKSTHVGIYLKNKYFAHASSSKGVVINHLDETYYKKRWRKGSRP